MIVFVHKSTERDEETLRETLTNTDVVRRNCCQPRAVGGKETEL